MFETLSKMTEEQVRLAVDTLNRGDPVAVLVDPRPLYVVFLSSAARGLPYEVDFALVGSDRTTPVAVMSKDRGRLLLWSEDAIRRICTLWKERYPES